VRPTRPARLPAALAAALPPRSPLARLYELVWRRAAASQMADARIAQARAGAPPHAIVRVFSGSGRAALALRVSTPLHGVSHLKHVGGRRAVPFAGRLREGGQIRLSRLTLCR